MATSWSKHGVAFVLFFLHITYVYGARNDVLIIVNDNSKDSKLVGEFYAQQRTIPAQNIVSIKTPNQVNISWAQFQSLRDQILRNGICPSTPLDKRPAACTDMTLPIYTADNINALTTNSAIRYIVTTRGIPQKFTPDPTSTLFSPTEVTSVDNYLKFWLARYLTTDITFNFPERKSAFADGQGMRIVIPSFDKEYIVGRIDGVDLESAKALVSRAIAAESNGLYGKLYGSTFGSTGGNFSWYNYAAPYSNQYIYGDAQTSWRYTFGLFGENRAECSDYQSPSHYFAFSPSATSGKSPSYCLAQFNKGTPNEAIAGLSYSRQPIAQDALAYFGSLDGQSIEGGFNTYLNWRKNNTCSPTLCADSQDPAACRAASIDPYKEINTQCVGVADGFIGYNFQSYPVAQLGISPTGWNASANTQIYVASDTGYDDNHSIWIGQPDETPNPQCPTYTNNLLGTTTQSCDANHWGSFTQKIAVSGIDPNTPPTYTLSHYRIAKDMPGSGYASTSVTFTYPKTAGVTCPTGLTGGVNDLFCKYVSNASNASSEWIQPTDTTWKLISRTISPPVNTGFSYTSIEISIRPGTAKGSIGIDQVSLQNTADATELVTNGSFNQGHRQTSFGDFAANFLNRLGGTAFWGSLSHHQSAGHSFDNSSLGTLVYFMRGLPLGDAVWLGDTNNSGIFYGDPLYSPISVRLMKPLTNQWNMAKVPVTLSGSAVNGRDSLKVNTTYAIEYCKGNDFYLCGNQSNPWLPTGISGTGGLENMPLGALNAPPGMYTFRLAVNSSNSQTGKSQTFYDYIALNIYTDTSDIDNDGLKDTDEINIYGTNPIKSDTDGDGLSDGDEINIHHTNPLKTDTDGDGLSDSNEINIRHTDPLKADTDGDGYKDGYEVSYGGDPLNANSIPLVITSRPVTTAEAEISYTYQVKATWGNVAYILYGPTGMAIDTSSGLITWTPTYDQINTNEFVYLSVSSGNYTNYQFFSISIKHGNTGDINEDGKIDISDALLAQRFSLGLQIPSAQQKVRADLFHDGIIDISDYLTISRKTLGN